MHRNKVLLRSQAPYLWLFHVSIRHKSEYMKCFSRFQLGANYISQVLFTSEQPGRNENHLRIELDVFSLITECRIRKH